MIRTVLLLAAVTITGPAWALNMSGFRDTPIARLNGQELKAFRQAIVNTLNQTPDGGTIEWRATRIGFAAKISPQRSYAEDQLRCREAIVEAETPDRYQRGWYRFCRGLKGDWEIRLRAAKRKAR